ncbi:bifunctional [glutamate--ammonia ligase]-adenylyl-L-tyrosine phosphorylase/[glutamate--ammonia-ligase] adenylyltransferase [Ferrimonas balearica]|uniref:bifunctional [glutamate--ammonia ligase]-adenylyl-L-tyrosine phosphorylase/[glutamate--ammonia-ligase] adenylyltransferase n=1 Tax=Ferrimonas balearica TaxID=44012 RepID=UPI001C994EDE|nr:bifunctional [glutamate--ammonia ligase]-adenylyl-L-tyrosine phosphorylase/[glutamate--ammonia-ligase] adenylyltransferase [Ferrimonas balearica]MBY5923023.1 bifunctional [glutamate--ammonia ligase]-adenylyl-L-tyrosine phosphorylase/[glutamate--ammonia-ligase] adenylyltransferase [Ferrimonas balearica]MBY5997600.1 bifunctional [glutamate--ammonia ligase]-adenylyl-L-tyrosine phosphorylase/[glutamate--ammonia-ligase] adenylyltransferase [Ferrimonas balearica]
MTSVPHDNKLSPALVQQAQRAWERLEPEVLSRLDEPARATLWRLLALSEYLGQVWSRDSQGLTELMIEGQLQHGAQADDYGPALARELAGCCDDTVAMATLRRFRHRALSRIAARDLLDLAPLDETLALLSALAEAMVVATRDYLAEQLAPQWGRPTGSDGQPLQLMILGMGKLGGGELNFSSDIDLIFTYLENGVTVGGRRELDNQQYFIRLGQKLINLLAQTTVDGFCYRVDMRLRPFGEAGPLVVSLAALEDYYQEQGREWERYAMVKARLLGATETESTALANLLRPFVYRRYLDFSAIDALRRMKGLIESQLRRQALSDNIKLGRGGIREVEFVAQTHQLIRGGREPSLRQSPLRPVLMELKRLGLLDDRSHRTLVDGYALLRKVENRLQALNDGQTQTLPSDPDNQLRLALALGEETPDALWAQIQNAMSGIHQVFRDTIGAEQDAESELGALPALWQGPGLDLDGEAILAEQGLEPGLWPRVQATREEFEQRRIGPRGRDVLDKLIPRLLQKMARQKDQQAVWLRVTSVLTTILTRTTYLELLLENPGAARQLVTLCAASPWIAEQLSRYPILLDELIDPVALYQPLPPEGYAAELREYLLRVPEDDLEQQMEALRQFKQAHQLRIAAADVTRVLPVMKVSDHLTWLAEAIIEQVVNLAWLQLTARHGQPRLEAEGRGFAVIAYGKLGGLELGYGSDLDLVFLHSAGPGETDGTKPIDNSHFYVKLAQRILHLFSTRTVSGVLYEVDTRLRPSGSAGLLVSQIDRFEEYQREEAWTWEHQALVRARFVYGDDALAGRFARLRRQLLCLPRDPATLREDVVSMRAKMRDHLDRSDKTQFDLKQGPGGITDIEFITQYLVLKEAAECPAMATWSDNVRILETALAQGKLGPQFADRLIRTYIDLRDTSHHRVLAGEGGSVPLEARPAACDAVQGIWDELLGQQ